MNTFLPAVLRGGVGIVQLREKYADLDAQRIAAREMRAICQEFNVPFIMNDDPELALEVAADGVHVGQDDVTVEHCRAVLGEQAIIGISTHADDEFSTALALAVTYRSAGPIVATPTKLERIPTGVEYALRCQSLSADPVYVTGGVDAEALPELLRRGLRHFVVVRALTESTDPESSARVMADLIRAANQ
jgi:thiamine-phosphate pyrophosphorylase